MTLGGALASDTAALHELCAAILSASPGVHAMRDPTRGGLGAVLALAGLWIYEDLWVRAGQAIPLS